MVSGLAIVVQKGPDATEYVFDRVPVLVGRDESVVGLCLPDASVSRVHARLDLREGAIWVRDARSTNGTRFQGNRVADNGWTRLCDSSEEVILDVGIFRLRVRGLNVELRAMTETSSASLDLVTSIPSRPQPMPQAAPAKSPNADDVELVVQRWRSARDALLETLRTAPAQALLQKHPELADDVGFARVLNQVGGRPAPPERDAHETEVMALSAIQELASWYLGPSHVPAHAAAVTAFKDKLRAALDEFMLGYVPLLGSISKLAHELALATDGGDSLRRPSSASDFARRLLDWQDPTDSAAKSIRESLSEVIVHQAGMLNGIMRGVQALLRELAPSTIEGALERSEAKAGLLGRAFGARERELWELFKARYADLADEEQERFRILFGKEFAEEYLQFTGETRVYDGARREK